ncbi:MAG: hypothetical protein J7K23_06210 [Thermoproteales archaeon]|nr:hypothetical protein [Thermoproteales archaeon]
MDPRLGRIAFNIGIFLLLISIIPLFFVEKGSASYIIGIVSTVVSLIFLLIVIYEIRREVKKELKIKEI